MSNYETSVRFVIENHFSCSIVSRLTLNLIMIMAHVHNELLIYSDVILYYLLDDRYDENYRNWEEYEKTVKDIRRLISRLQENEVFELNEMDKDNVLNDMHIRDGFGGEVPAWVSFEKRLAYMNGAELLCCLEYIIGLFEKELTGLKMPGLRDDDCDLAEFYELNYLLYAQLYWPSQQVNFRSHVAHQILRDNVTIDRLERERSDEIKKFEVDVVGQIWRDYSEDKAKMALEMRRQRLTIKEWHYFFNTLFKIEEYERWIEELQHPASTIEKEYPQSDWDKIFKDTIDVKKVKVVIPTLLPEDFSLTNWFVVHKILEEIDWLQDEMDTHFILWVKDVYGWEQKTEHFKSVNSALKKQHSLDWNVRTMTSASVMEDYIKLAKKIRDEFVKQMDGKTVKEDNKYYFKKDDLFINHKKYR